MFRHNQLPYLDLEHFPSARMVDPEARRNPSESRQEAHTEKQALSRDSSKPPRCQPEDRLLGEHPPLPPKQAWKYRI